VTRLQVDKLQFVLYIKEIPTVEGRNAELALWRRSTDEAEKILVQVQGGGGCVV
jgi:intraflagellar transport protein 80